MLNPWLILGAVVVGASLLKDDSSTAPAPSPYASTEREITVADVKKMAAEATARGFDPVAVTSFAFWPGFSLLAEWLKQRGQRLVLESPEDVKRKWGGSWYQLALLKRGVGVPVDLWKSGLTVRNGDTLQPQWILRETGEVVPLESMGLQPGYGVRWFKVGGSKPVACNTFTKHSVPLNERAKYVNVASGIGQSWCPKSQVIYSSAPMVPVARATHWLNPLGAKVVKTGKGYDSNTLSAAGAAAGTAAGGVGGAIGGAVGALGDLLGGAFSKTKRALKTDAGGLAPLAPLAKYWSKQRPYKGMASQPPGKSGKWYQTGPQNVPIAELGD